MRATFKRFLQNLAKRSLTGGDLLEVGCGYGYLLDLARPFFSSRTGTDFSPEAAEIARATDAEVFVGGVEQLPSGAKFDCVLATQVIEHIYDPLAFRQTTSQPHKAWWTHCSRYSRHRWRLEESAGQALAFVQGS